MTSFNDGIEAAAKRLRGISHEGLKSSWWRERFESAARSVEALKRPEPSEGERVEKVAAVIERELMTDEMLLADPTTLRKIKSQRIARAALKAMEVVAGRVELEERGKPGVVLSGFNDGDGADVEAVLETTCAEEQASKRGLWDADNADYCEGCGNGDKVPANGYWRCPKCDAEWPGDEG